MSLDISKRTHSQTCGCQQTLHDLVRIGNFKSVKDLIINKKINVNSIIENGLTLLHVAAECGQTDILKLLLEVKAEVNSLNKYDFTPLHLASDLESVKILVKFGADVNLQSLGGWHALHVAVKNGKLDIIKFLILSCNVDIHVTNFLGYTPLHFACSALYNKNGYNEKIVKFLLKNRAQINYVDYLGSTPLMHLIVHHDFLEFGRSINDKFNKFFRFLLKYSDLDFVSFYSLSNKKLYKMYLENVALLLSCGVPISSFKDIISESSDLNNYFILCRNELLLTKSTKLRNSWLTVHNFLVGNKNKLKNYAGNQNVIGQFENWDEIFGKFPIYGDLMKKNVNKGLKRRGFFDEACILLSECLPIFNSTHLIFRDTFECLTTKDLSKFCKNNFFYVK